MRKSSKAERRKKAGLEHVAYVGLAGTAVIFIIGMIWAATRSSSPVDGTAETVPPYFASAATAHPFPRLLRAADFREYPTVQHAYSVAALIPRVLAQQPCYCHCDQMGHRSLLDCYASQHAAYCGVCLKEALLAGQLTEQGQDPATIRQKIIRGAWGNVRLSGTLP